MSLARRPGGSALRADALEGTVRRNGNRVRVSTD
jgi:TolB-like protein